MGVVYFTDSTGHRQPFNYGDHDHFVQVDEDLVVREYAALDHDHFGDDDTGWIEETAFGGVWKNHETDNPDPYDPYGRLYYRRRAGVVYLKGVVEAEAAPSDLGSTIFTLPPGFRPLATLIVRAATDVQIGSPSFYAHAQRIDISPLGAVTPQYMTTTSPAPAIGTWLSLSGISFLAMQ